MNSTKTSSSPPTPGMPAAHAALFDAVYADPRSDAPRERLGRALRDEGDPRGEFIELQLMKARGDARTKAQDKQEKALLKAHAEAWLGPFAPLVRRADCAFERGFPSFLWFKTLTTRAQIEAFERILAEPPWATVRRTESLPMLSSSMRSLEDAGLTVDALRDAVRAGLHEVVPLTTLQVVHLGLATHDDLAVVRSFPTLRSLRTPTRGELGFADLLDASWPALEAVGTGEFVQDFPCWLERRGALKLRTAFFTHPEFQLRLDGRRAHVSHARSLLDGELPTLLARMFESGVDTATADTKSAPLVAPVAARHGLAVAIVDE